MTFFDTHTHFHDPAWPGGLIWPKATDPWYRTCLPETYRAEIGAGPVVAVETSPRPLDDQRLEELAAGDPTIRCYVNNLQPLEPGFEARLAASRRRAKWRGLRLRPIVTYSLSATPLIDALAALEGVGHVELGIQSPDRLAELCTLCKALPGVRFVLTHSGHPRLTEPGDDFAHHLLEGIENLHVKLSPPQQARFEDLSVQTRYGEHIDRLRRYLPGNRFVAGSNWPVAPDCRVFLDHICDIFCDEIFPDALLCQNACGLYRVKIETEGADGAGTADHPTENAALE